MILNDYQIEKYAKEKGMIEPFSSKQVVKADGSPLISFGLSSFGYDIRCTNKFKVFTDLNSTVINPKNFDPKNFIEIESDCLILPPRSFALSVTPEKFNIPRNILGICLGKSTYARSGINVVATPLEPEWEGYLTLEFSNMTTLPAMIYAYEGVAQILFLEGQECRDSYKDRGGKYQGQPMEPILPRMKL